MRPGNKLDRRLLDAFYQGDHVAVGYLSVTFQLHLLVLMKSLHFLPLIGGFPLRP